MGSNSIVNPVGKNFLGTGGTPLNRPISAFGSGGLSEFTQKNPFGVPINNPIASVFGNGDSSSNPYVSGPFSLDPNQLALDKANINAEGQKQYEQTTTGIDRTANAETQRAKDLFQQMLPDIAENAQAAHVYDSTGYANEVARQQANIASQIAQQQAQQKLAALQGLQGFQTGALQRGLSLEDQINNANISKSIGQAFAPQPPTGKQNFGTVAQGVGALAPIAKMAIK